MARIAAAAVSGTLSSALASGDTTMAAAALANLPAISGGDYAAITIGYDRPGGAIPETVWVTAHGANATSATIVRAREGTTARAWDSGAAWVHGPTPEDRRAFNDGTFASPASPVLIVDALPSGVDALAFQVWCEQALGRLLRFSIENNYSLTDALCDVNFRNSVVEIGSDDPAVSIAGTQLRLFKPTGDTSNALTYYRPGSRTLVAFRVNSAGTVVIGVGGQASVAAQIETAGAANARWDISEFGAQRWGPGGASALDTTLARTAAAELTLTGTLKQTGTPTASTDVATVGWVRSAGRMSAANAANITGAASIDASSHNVFPLTLTGNVTSFTVNSAPTTCRLVLLLTQDGTGGRTFAFPGAWNWLGADAPTISTAAGSTTAIEVLVTAAATYAWPGEADHGHTHLPGRSDDLHLVPGLDRDRWDLLDRRHVTQEVAGLGNGSLLIAYFTARETRTVTGLSFAVRVILGSAPSAARIGLATVDGSDNPTAILNAFAECGTAMQTLGWSGVLTLTAAPTLVRGQRYAVLIRQDGGGSALRLHGVANQITALNDLPPRLSATKTNAWPVPGDGAVTGWATHTAIPWVGIHCT